MAGDSKLRKISSVEERLRSLNEKKKKILDQSREKNKRVAKKRLLEIGRLIEKARLQDLNLDNNLLLGAFLDIAERSVDEKNHSLWASKVNLTETQESRIIISFKDQSASSEAKSLLKNLGFRWNSIRNEYYGRGTMENIKSAFKLFECKIESVS